MNDAIFSLLPVRSGSTIASVRIGRWLSDHLGIPLLDDARILEVESLRNLFIINGSTLYCGHLPAIATAVMRANQVIWVQNDYTLPPPAPESNAESPFRKAFRDRKLVPHYWSTCDVNAFKTPKSRWINWNVLGFMKGAVQADLESESVIYYGAYRQNREAEFQFMYKCLALEDLHISSTSAKFPPSLLVRPFREDLHFRLAQYGMGVYAQDSKSASGGHSPATRFYEMLSAGLPMMFTPSCVESLGRYGYDVSRYVMTEFGTRKLIDARLLIREEQKVWLEDFETQLKSRVSEAYDALNR